jgi:hypothetical protein
MTATPASVGIGGPRRAEAAVPVVSTESNTVVVALVFAFKTFVASLLARSIAFWLGLDEPRWALRTVFVVSHPDSGLVVAKSFYRALGAIAGAGVSSLLGRISSAYRYPRPTSLAKCAWEARYLRRRLLTMARAASDPKEIEATLSPFDGTGLASEARRWIRSPSTRIGSRLVVRIWTPDAPRDTSFVKAAAASLRCFVDHE